MPVVLWLREMTCSASTCLFVHSSVLRRTSAPTPRRTTGAVGIPAPSTQVGPPLRGRTSPARGAAITTARPWHLPVRSWLRTSPHLIRLFVHHYDALPALTCSFHVTLPHSRCPRAAAQPLPSGNIEQLVGTLQLEQLARQLHLLCVRHRAWRVMCTRRHTRNRIDNGHLLPPAYATTLHPWKH